MNKISKPKGTIISSNLATHICSHWHSGQWSSFYSFASSKQYIDDKYNNYISELEKCEKHATRSEKKELKRLKRFFDYKHWEANQQTTITI